MMPSIPPVRAASRRPTQALARPLLPQSSLLQGQDRSAQAPFSSPVILHAEMVQVLCNCSSEGPVES